MSLVCTYFTWETQTSSAWFLPEFDGHLGLFQTPHQGIVVTKTWVDTAIYNKGL